MDYIDRLKRAAIPLGTFMVLSSGAALAQDQLTKADLVQLAVTLGVYDNRCEKLAPRLLADVQRLVRMLDKDDVMAGVISRTGQSRQSGRGEVVWRAIVRWSRSTRTGCSSLRGERMADDERHIALHPPQPYATAQRLRQAARRHETCDQAMSEERSSDLTL